MCMDVKGRKKITGLVGEERQGDGEELVSPVRDRILTKVKLSKQISIKIESSVCKAGSFHNHIWLCC